MARILIVDDDYEVIETLRMALESREHEVMVANDGNEGLMMAEQETPDLIILDMMMPKRSGFLVLENIRRNLPNYAIPVIMITANEGKRHEEYARKLLGVVDYIHKPFAIDRLLEAVENAVAPKS